MIDSIAVDVVKASKKYWENPAYQNDTPSDMEMIVPIALGIDKDPKKIKNKKKFIISIIKKGARNLPKIIIFLGTDRQPEQQEDL